MPQSLLNAFHVSSCDARMQTNVNCASGLVLLLSVDKRFGERTHILRCSEVRYSGFLVWVLGLDISRVTPVVFDSTFEKLLRVTLLAAAVPIVWAVGTLLDNQTIITTSLTVLGPCSAHNCKRSIVYARFDPARAVATLTCAACMTKAFAIKDRTNQWRPVYCWSAIRLLTAVRVPP